MLRNQPLEHKIFYLQKKFFLTCFIKTPKTNISIQYGVPVPQRSSITSLDVASLPWMNVSGYNFNIMNTCHEFVASSM